MGRPKNTILSSDTKFWAMLQPDVSHQDCWPWTRACSDNGYGSFRLYLPDGSQETAAHRVAWILAYGYIPDGCYVLHACDNKPCCRPSHLFLGTSAENTQDMLKKKRHGARERGDAWGMSRTYAIIYPACVYCGLTASRHLGHGLCAHCYDKARQRPLLHPGIIAIMNTTS